MKKLALVGLLALSSAASAQDYFYGAQIGEVTAEADSNEVSIISLTGVAGTYLSDDISVEARLATGIDKDDGVSLDHHVGVYGKLHWPVAEVVQPYALLGVSRTQIDDNGTEASENDFAFGLGINFKLNEQINVNFEYINIAEILDVKVDAINLGVTVTL